MVSLNPISLKQWQDENLEHLRYEFDDLKPEEYCLDIGSYRREWSNEMIKRYAVQVECFDALDNKAAWMFNGKLAFGGAYYYTSAFDDKKTVEYWCVDIAPYLDREVSVMKMNIEGHEYQLLKYILDKGLMKNIRHLQVQFHLIDGKDNDLEYYLISERLKETHELQWRYPFVWESWKRKQRPDVTLGREQDEVTLC